MTDTLKGNPRGRRGRFTHRRIRAPGRFAQKSPRTVQSGRARVIVGHLKGERRRTRRGRRRLTVQAVLTPKRARRNPQQYGISEHKAWIGVRNRALALLEKKLPAWAHRDAEAIRAYADAMLDQLGRGVHENPALAIVGANPPMGRVVEIRYHRDRGNHPGYYKHHFRHRPVMVALNDGSLKIGPN